MAFNLFMSYAKEDTALRDELDTHLSEVRRQNIIHDWYDGDIVPGTEYKKQALEHLNSADIILLLISPDFMKAAS